MQNLNEPVTIEMLLDAIDMMKKFQIPELVLIETKSQELKDSVDEDFGVPIMVNTKIESNFIAYFLNKKEVMNYLYYQKIDYPTVSQIGSWEGHYRKQT